MAQRSGNWLLAVVALACFAAMTASDAPQRLEPGKPVVISGNTSAQAFQTFEFVYGGDEHSVPRITASTQPLSNGRSHWDGLE